MTLDRNEDALSDLTCNKRILIVDDNEDFVHTLAILLNQWGHVTNTAYDGVTALVKAVAFVPDVVILDMCMPFIDGHETARRFRQSLVGSALLIISISGDSANFRNSSLSQEVDYQLTKPLDFELLKSILNSPNDT